MAQQADKVADATQPRDLSQQFDIDFGMAVFSQNWLPNPTCRKTPSGGRRIAKIIRNRSILLPLK